MATILFSIILPIFDPSQTITTTLDSLSPQHGEFEVVVVQRYPVIATDFPFEQKTTVVTHEGVTRGSLLNFGVTKATGDVFLFLWPGSRLPDDALLAIETNFNLLPQSMGGNFHVTYEDPSFFTRRLEQMLKMWRYQGRYFGHSGIFVRREAFEALGGFHDVDLLEDYDFAQRLDNYGATLFLPQHIIASTSRFQNRKVQATISWAAIYALYRLGISPNTLAKLYFS
ncbi:MAG: glycosyltransferase [Anaerolineae bacterium]|nr:glycosyltransferase [Anaerolineae bacterium]